MNVVVAVQPVMTSPLLMVQIQLPEGLPHVKFTFNGAHPSSISAEKVTLGNVLIIMSMVALVAHSPAAGVNEYVETPLTAVLIVDGLQLPEIALSDIAGRPVVSISFSQKGPSCINDGNTGGLTVTVII